MATIILRKAVMLNQTLESFGSGILMVGGLIGSIGVILAFGHRWILTPLLRELDERISDRVIATLTSVNEKLEDIEANVADIRHEVNTNNGKSLKDVALRTRTEVAVLTTRLDHHLAHHQSDHPKENPNE